MSENPHSHNDEVQDSSASAPVHSTEYSHDEQTDATVPLTPEYAAELREPNVPADADAAEVTVPWGTHPSADTAERKGTRSRAVNPLSWMQPARCLRCWMIRSLVNVTSWNLPVFFPPIRALRTLRLRQPGCFLRTVPSPDGRHEAAAAARAP
ncbi:hypothetical protein RA11412_0741 [Rothia aeria]|uniref:Uncharacterized protein n=1 Tax=Rothia aeria TaxID=172042 RepID=A0A2Z5QXJ8_9MICC|nr:hypothetical protein RA11412_0741 [Rothia aeria]